MWNLPNAIELTENDIRNSKGLYKGLYQKSKKCEGYNSQYKEKRGREYEGNLITGGIHEEDGCVA